MRGMHHLFTAKLIKEHGMEWWDKKEAGSHATVKVTRQDYLDMLDKWK